MDFDRLMGTMRQAAKIYRLTMKETGLILGVPFHRVKRWHKDDNIDLTLREFVKWADLLGYEITLKRKLK